VGDDLTEETAFVVLDAPAPTVVVADTEGDRPTAARFRLRGPDDVLTLLQRLAS
jgi:trehalose-6-phosphatase